ncbi:MAG: hypothetical protein Q9214_001998 [Letrouitia sp. 1 TL-2023]
MASALTANSYLSHRPIFVGAPQHPPSPPVEDLQKCTLPSIQSLIGDMAESPASSPSRQTERQQSSQSPHTHQVSPHAPDTRPSQAYNQPTVSNPSTLPPTPPLKPDVGFDSPQQSVLVGSSRSTTGTLPAYYGTRMNSSDMQQQRQQPPPSSHPGHASLPPTSQSPYQNPPYPTSPTVVTSYSYPSPAHPSIAASPMYYQRPLPTTFPPAAPVPLDPSLPSSPHASPIEPNSPWQHQHQHHHYISPSTSAAFSGQPQDRYICQTCNKAFSRPSSLRIHSHSHTGEKPFKCPHPGCGKAFSVRSNMKRHERGCHGGGSPGST